MLRWFLLVLLLVLFATSLLTVVRAPSWSPWQLAVLAGEYGHLLGLAALGLAALAWGLRGDQPAIALVNVGLALVAVTLFAVPLVQAWRIGATLPERLRASFGPVTMTRPPFSFAALFARDPSRVRVRPIEVKPGQVLDFYAPERADAGPAPCVVVVHGGGWNGGDRRQMAHFNHWLAHQGWAVAAVSYRLAPEHLWPAQRDDLLAAMTTLRARATELNIDPGRLVLLGRSAGGQIALATAYTQALPGLRGAIGLYTPADLLFGYEHAVEDDMLGSPRLMRQFLGGTPQTARANYVSASATGHVTAQTPPTLLLHGVNDALVWHQHSVRLEAELARHGVPHAFVSLPWATHAFEFNLNGPGGQLTTYAVTWFLRSREGGPPAERAMR